jgi:hypothetical protein
MKTRDQNTIGKDLFQAIDPAEARRVKFIYGNRRPVESPPALSNSAGFCESLE